MKFLRNNILYTTITTLGLLPISCGTITPKNIAKFSAGAVTGGVIHENAHYITAETQGMNPGWNSKNPTEVEYRAYEDKNNNKKRIVDSAGIVAQTLATEIILNINEIPKNDSYTLGLLAFTIGDNIRYGLFPNLRGKSNSDVEQLDKVGIKKEYVQSALLAHSAFSLYRLYKLWKRKDSEKKGKKDMKKNIKKKNLENKLNFSLNCNRDKLGFKVKYNF